MSDNSYRIEIQELQEVMHRHGYYDTAFIPQAIDCLKRIFSKDTYRTKHSVQVALWVSRMGMPASVVLCALFHEIDMDNQSQELLRREDAISVHKAYRELNKVLHSEGNYSFNTTAEVNRQALYIKFADRISVLRYYNRRKSKHPPQYLERSNEFLLRMAQQDAAEYVVNELEDRIMRFEHGEWHHMIFEQRELIKKENREAFKEIKRTFDEILLPKASNTPSDIGMINQHVVDLDMQQRSIAQLFHEQKERSDTPLVSEKIAELTVSKYSIPLYDIYIIFNNMCDYRVMLKDFFDFFTLRLREIGAHLKGIRWADDWPSSYIVLCDRSSCRYRIFLRDEETYLRKRFGSFASVYIWQQNMRYRGEPKVIRVYDRSNHERWVPKGSTLLDFAFSVHPEVAFKGIHAIRNGKQEPLLSTQPLQSGDAIEIIRDPNEQDHVTIDYFKYVTTEKSVKDLVHYFKVSKGL